MKEGRANIEVDEIKLSRFLFVALTEEEIQTHGIGELLHTTKVGEKMPKMTEQEITGGEQFRTKPKTRLCPTARKPNVQEIKQLTAIAMGWLVNYIMKNFLYTFGEKTGDRRMEDLWEMNSLRQYQGL